MQYMPHRPEMLGHFKKLLGYLVDDLDLKILIYISTNEGCTYREVLNNLSYPKHKVLHRIFEFEKKRILKSFWDKTEIEGKRCNIRRFRTSKEFQPCKELLLELLQESNTPTKSNELTYSAAD